MRGILINPWDKTITETEIDGHDYRAIAPMLSEPEAEEKPGHKVWRYQLLGISQQGDTMYLDEEGALSADVPVFRIRSDTYPDGFYPHPIAGRALILGSTGDGDPADVTLSLTHVKQMIAFTDSATTGTFTPSTEHAGPNGFFVINGGSAILKPRA